MSPALSVAVAVRVTVLPEIRLDLRRGPQEIVERLQRRQVRRQRGGRRSGGGFELPVAAERGGAGQVGRGRDVAAGCGFQRIEEAVAARRHVAAVEIELTGRRQCLADRRQVGGIIGDRTRGQRVGADLHLVVRAVGDEVDRRETVHALQILRDLLQAILAPSNTNTLVPGLIAATMAW